MWQGILLFLCAAFAIGYGQSPKYFVSPMKSFRLNSNYPVTVTIFDQPISKWTTVLTIEKDKVDVVSMTKDLQITGSMSSVSQEFNLAIPASLTPGTFYLSVSMKKAGSPAMTNRTMIKLQRKTNMIMIQTDKGIYKPGARILFRVFALDIDLVPVKGTFNIYLKDSKGNRIKQWLSISPDASGVFNDEYLLDMITPLGTWKLQVELSGEKEEVTITVEEYVLPRYEVTVSLPSLVMQSDDEVVVSVDAVYTYGEPVKGVADVKAYLNSNGKPFYTTSMEQKGEHSYTIDMRMQRNSMNLKVVVDFTDTLGSEKRSGSATAVVHKNMWKVDFGATPDTIKPQLTFKVRGRLSRQDNVAPPVNSILTIGYKFSLSSPCYWRGCQQIPTVTYINKTAQTDTEGDFVVDLDIPRNATTLNIQAYYKGTSIKSHSISSTFKTNSKENIEVSLQQVTTSSATFNVRTTFDVDKVYYQVLSKGLVVSSGGAAPSAGDLKSVDISVVMDAAMVAKLAPRARLVVYTLYSEELIADSIKFDVDGIFKYQTSMKFDASRKTVGENTALTIDTNPNSFVALVAIDQSVLLLKKGNDISKKVVLEKLDEFYVKDASNKGCRFCGRMKRSIMPWPMSGQTNSHIILTSAGLAYLTNANIISRSYDEIFPPFESLEKTGATASPGQPDTDSSSTRKNFPETWIWNDVISGADGKVVFNAKVPDTITSYVANAFALHAVKGLSVSNTAKLEGFKSFYVTPKLPYSVVFGETFILTCVVYNYLSVDVTVTVTLDQSRKEFTLAGTNVTTVSIKKNSGAEVDFIISPTKLKNIQIKLVADANGIARDTVIKHLLVKPEGKTVYGTQAYFVDRSTALVDEPPFTQIFKVPFPANAVPDTRYIEVVVMGDVMGPALTGLARLVRAPYGCGEQNMVTLVPSISVRKYLLAMNALSPEMNMKTKQYMETGYQRELAYQRKDKSFSAFGDQDSIGSTWLTTFVLKTFFEINILLPGVVDDQVLIGALNFVLSKQDKNGLFHEHGQVIHTNMQGGASKGPTLTAYIHIMFQKIPNKLKSSFDPRLTAAIALTNGYLLKQLELPSIQSSNYALAIMALAFQMSGDFATATRIYNILKPRAISEDSGAKIHYEVSAKKPSVKKSSYHSGGPSAIEITGYVLMMLTEKNDMSEGLNLAKYLLGMRNSAGGCVSTQDTVVGLESLAGFAAKVFKPTNSTSLTIKVKLDMTKQFIIDNTNMRLYQRVAKEEPASNAVDLHVSGKGVTLIQISWSFNVPVEESEGKKPDVTLIVEGLFGNKEATCAIKACVRIDNQDNPGMYIAEIQLPSGQSAETPKRNVKLAKSEVEGDKVNLYFQNLKSGVSTCVLIQTRKTAEVTNRKPSVAVAYDYYDPDSATATTTFMSLNGTTTSTSAPSLTAPTILFSITTLAWVLA